MRNITKIVLSLGLCASLVNAAGFGEIEFEPKKDISSFEKVELGFNADLTFNYQGLDHDFIPTNTANRKEKLQAGLSLPTANLDLNAKIMKGFNVKLETMLSSHHHHETFVKGGYATIDNLDFVYSGFAKDFMDQSTIKVGVDDINFGDAHFRRTDNADVMNNPFIMNMAVEAYMQAGFVELMHRLPAYDSIVVAGISNGQVNPSDVSAEKEGSDEYSFYVKYAFDKEINEDLRVRLSESVFFTEGTSKNSLYQGDKAGNVAEKIFNQKGEVPVTSDFGAAWNAMKGYSDLTVSMTNAFIKYNNTELFGLLEITDGSDSSSNDMEMIHYSVDLVQRFGKDNRFYGAVRYENATTELASDTSGDNELTQLQVGLGWFLSKNAVAKVEYIKQERDNFAEYTNGKAKFDGFMISTALSF